MRDTGVPMPFDTGQTLVLLHFRRIYLKQSGGQMPVSMGSRFQKGHRLGSILSGLFRRVLPFLKANVKNFATTALRTGVDVEEDVFDNGKKFTDSLKERVRQGIKRAVQNLHFSLGVASVREGSVSD